MLLQNNVADDIEYPVRSVLGFVPASFYFLKKKKSQIVFTDQSQFLVIRVNGKARRDQQPTQRNKKKTTNPKTSVISSKCQVQQALLCPAENKKQNRNQKEKAK
jgi:hypothetical protein